MGKKTKNWIFAGIGLAIFVLGIPLVEQVIASGGSSAPALKPASTASNKPAVCQNEDSPKMAHPSVIPVGDNYLQIVPNADGSVGAVLYDSNFAFLGTNDNETNLSFSLADGAKKVVKISALSPEVLQGQATGKNCCATSATGAEPGAAKTCPVHQEAGEAGPQTCPNHGQSASQQSETQGAQE